MARSTLARLEGIPMMILICQVCKKQVDKLYEFYQIVDGEESRERKCEPCCNKKRMEWEMAVWN